MEHEPILDNYDVSESVLNYEDEKRLGITLSNSKTMANLAKDAQTNAAISDENMETALISTSAAPELLGVASATEILQSDSEMSVEHKPESSLGSNVQLTEITSSIDSDVSNFVIDALRTVIPTQCSVHNCAASLQSQFADDPHLLSLCLGAVVDFFLSVDNAARRNAFYVLNDLVQYDPRFRVPVLRAVLPRISWTIASMSEREPYLKTVSVWRERKIYPPDVCHAVEGLFLVADARKKNAAEFEQRLNSFVDVARIRSAKDEELEKQLRDTSSSTSSDNSVDIKAATAAAIMAASTSELKSMTMAARTALLVTQGTVEYLSRLLIDFDQYFSSANVSGMTEVLDILDRSNSPANLPNSNCLKSVATYKR